MPCVREAGASGVGDEDLAGGATVGRESRIHNPKEAETIVDTLERLTEDGAYRDKTIVVIVLQRSG
ncbi:hypothetical protein [Streptomyces sp. NPDC057302]|uniref:hypothetical protein n=1 Tax=Streptomyces sp. NPDC057302 TaxID=3346094 RepID=UPI00362ECFF1